MSGVPHYRIRNCCSSEQSFSIIALDNDGAFQSGLHTALGDDILFGGFEIVEGQCYVITYLGPIFGVPPGGSADYLNFTNTEVGTIDDCTAYTTTPCPCPWLYYVSPCCREFGNQGAAAQQVNLFLSDLEYEEGTYQYTGALNEVLGTDLILEPGQCYTITRNLEAEPIQTTVELDFSTASWQQMNLELGCDDGRCQDCPEEGIAYLKYEPCCDSFDTIYVRTESYSGSQTIDPSGQVSGSGPGNIGPIVNTAGYTGVFQFVATTQASQLSAFVPGQCYTGTLHALGSEAAPAPQDNGDYNDLPLAPYSTQLSKVGDCELPPCPECNPTVYALTNCEGITINTETDVSAYIDTYIELDSIPGCWFVQEYSPIIVNPGLGSTIDPSSEVGVGKIAISGPTKPNLPNTLPGLQTQPVTVTGPCECECKCYEVIGYRGTYTYIDCETGKSLLVFSSGADKFCAATRPNIVGREGIDYTLAISDCVDGECVDKCFLLTNCDPTAYPTQDATLNSTLQSLSQYANTDEVVVLSGYDGCWTVAEKNCSCLTITIDDTPIEALATGTFNGQSVFTFEYNSIVYYIWFNSVWFITTEIGGFIGTIATTASSDSCPVFGSTEAPVPDPLGWQSVPAGTVITTELCADQCDCPVDITVIRDYTDCEECLGITAYKLFNCEKINEVVYTLQDFSAYVGQVIKDDCNCWVVEEIDYQPPSETTIVDPIVFEDCNTCLTTYYTLTDCDDLESVIISSTNLSAYVGQVVKIEGCDPCYEVALYEETTAPALWEELTVTEASATCFECKQLVPRCSTVFNNSTEDRTFTYINANGDSEETEIVKSGHFSLRHCVQYWESPDTYIYNYHGDCTVYEYDNTPLPGECNCIDVTITPVGGIATVYAAVHTGEFYNNDKVYNLTVDSVPYFIWSGGLGGEWNLTDIIGSQTPGGEIGQIKSGIVDCPVAPVGSWTPGLMPSGIAVQELFTVEGACETLIIKEGHCVQYFPNDRKVRPGYNTPICSADKYDKITCNAADIMYKKVLELRYGISDCCPEENEKWLIKKELIELQALTDPNYTCDPLTDCCGQRLSSCSCNS